MLVQCQGHQWAWGIKFENNLSRYDIAACNYCVK